MPGDLGPALAVAAGNAHTCVVDGSVRCWDNRVDTTVPVRCWGNGADTTVPVRCWDNRADTTAPVCCVAARWRAGARLTWLALSTRGRRARLPGCWAW